MPQFRRPEVSPRSGAVTVAVLLGVAGVAWWLARKTAPTEPA